MRAGQFKTPLGRQWLISATRKQFVGDAIATREFKLDRDIGLMVQGEVSDGLFSYMVGAFNGAGKNARQDNNELMYVGRIQLSPLGKVKLSECFPSASQAPRLSFALATAFNSVEIESEDGAGTVGQDLLTMGGELAFFYRRLSAAAELFWRQEMTDGIGSDVSSLGGYAQAGFLLIPEVLEVAARGSMVRPENREPDADLWEAGPAVNWFLAGHRLKLQFDYTARVEESAGEDSTLDHRMRLQLQAIF